MKGGHLDSADSPDWLIETGGALRLGGARVPLKNTHGTGCTLSSAIAALIPQSDSLASATTEAKRYLTGAIENSARLDVGQASGRCITSSDGGERELAGAIGPVIRNDEAARLLDPRAVFAARVGGDHRRRGRVSAGVRELPPSGRATRRHRRRRGVAMPARRDAAARTQARAEADVPVSPCDACALHSDAVSHHPRKCASPSSGAGRRTRRDRRDRRAGP